MKSAILRTGTYFHSEPRSSFPCKVREPHTTVPYTGNVRMQFTALGLSTPFSSLVKGVLTPSTPVTLASLPAGAFQTPRLVSVRAYIPATKPHGGISRGRF